MQQRFAAQIADVAHVVDGWTPPVLKYGSIGFGAALTLHAGAYLITGTALGA
jgi:hypothetical protein